MAWQTAYNAVGVVDCGDSFICRFGRQYGGNDGFSDQGVYGLKGDVLYVSDDSLAISVASVGMTYSAVRMYNQLVGTFRQGKYGKRPYDDSGRWAAATVLRRQFRLILIGLSRLCLKVPWRHCRAH